MRDLVRPAAHIAAMCALRLILLVLTIAGLAAPAAAQGAFNHTYASDVIKTDYAGLSDLTAARSGTGGAALRLKKTDK